MAAACMFQLGSFVSCSVWASRLFGALAGAHVLLNNIGMALVSRAPLLIDVLEYLCLGVRVSRTPEGRVRCISSDSWLDFGFWIGRKLRAISREYALRVLSLHAEYFVQRRAASMETLGLSYRLPPYPGSQW